MKGLLNEFRSFADLLKRIKTLDVNAINANTSNKLKEGNVRLNEVITKLEACIDDQEQRSRVTCLLIDGVVENDTENTERSGVINNDLDLDDN